MGKRYDQLDLDDRIEICRLHAAGKSRREIGHLMGRDASTISRELRRNSLARGECKPASADRMALSRRRRLSKIERLSRLRDHVCDHLAMAGRPSRSPAGSGWKDQSTRLATSRSTASPTGKANNQ